LAKGARRGIRKGRRKGRKLEGSKKNMAEEI
jgi:hypothetical protein